MPKRLSPLVVLFVIILLIGFRYLLPPAEQATPATPSSLDHSTTPPAQAVKQVAQAPKVPTQTVAQPVATSDQKQKDAAYLPNSRLTPGDTLDVSAKDICVPGYATKVRDVPESVKQQAYKEYGILTHAPRAYEVDHLISLELGGSNSLKNLWPESYTGNWNAHVKDKLENKLHELVCKGDLELSTAQQVIAADWLAAYRKYIGQ